MTYRIFLVEDEIAAREGIRDSVDWARNGYEWGGEAPDGELALSMIEKDPPDILITDVKMPFMDGLELSRIVRSRYPHTRILILSGHDEFRYAQEAMQLGVAEYLLKPIGARELLATLARVCNSIDEERRHDEQLAHLRDRLDDNLAVVRQRLLVDLVTGRMPASAALNEAARLNLDLLAGSYMAMIVRCQVAPGTSQLARLEAYNGVRQRVADELAGRESVLLFVKDVEETALILKGEEPGSLRSSAEELAAHLAQLLGSEKPLIIGIGVGSVAHRLSELPQSFLEAFDAAKAQTAREVADVARVAFAPRELMAVDPTAAIAFLRTGDLHGIDPFLNVHLAPMSGQEPPSPAMVQFLVTDLLAAIARLVQAVGGVIEDLLPEREELEQRVGAADSLPKLRALMSDLLAAALTYRDHQVDHTHQMIVQAKNYIDAHLTDDSIALSVVADQVGWSPSHLSAVFSRTTGETFIEYLTRQRMAKARELLRMTTLPTAEVGQRVGYSNPRYFYAVFRKFTGQTPTEFRQTGR